jgi:hypothetical protein
MAVSENNLEFYTSIFGANEVATALEKLIKLIDDMAVSAEDASASSDALSGALSDMSKTAATARDSLVTAGNSGTEASVGLNDAAAAADRTAAAMERAGAASATASGYFRKGGIDAATADGYFGQMYKTLNTIEKIGTPAILRASNWVGLGGLGVAYESVKNFMTYNNKILQSITQAGVPLAEQGKIFQGVLDISRETGHHANDIADAFYRVSSALSGSHASMQKLLADTKAISEFNILGNIPAGANAEQSARVIMAAVNANLRGTPTNVNGIVGLMNAIVGSGDIRAQDLISAFGRGGLAVAKVNNISGVDYGAAIDTLTKLGASGSAAGTSVTRALQLLFNPTSQGSKGYSMIGLDYNSLQEANKSGGLAGALQLLEQHLRQFDPFANYPKFKGAAGTQGAINQMEQWFGNRLPQSFITSWENKDLTTAQQEQINAMMLNKMFGGSRSSGTVAALLQFLSAPGGFEEIRQNILAHSSPAYEQKMVRLAENSPSRRLQRLESNIMADLILIGQKLTPIVLDLAGAFETVLNFLQKNSFVLHEVLGVLGSVLAAGLAFRVASVGKALMTSVGGANAGLEGFFERHFGYTPQSSDQWSNSRKLYEAKTNNDYGIFSAAVKEFAGTTQTQVEQSKQRNNRSFASAVNIFAEAVDKFASGGGYGYGGGGGGIAGGESRINGEISEVESLGGISTVERPYGPFLGETYFNTNTLSRLEDIQTQNRMIGEGFVIPPSVLASQQDAILDRKANYEAVYQSSMANQAFKTSAANLKSQGFYIPGMPSIPEGNVIVPQNVGAGLSSRVENNSFYPEYPSPVIGPAGDFEKATLVENKKHTSLLGKIAGYFESKGGFGQSLMGALSGPAGMIAATALPLALPVIMSGISKLTSWLSSHSSNPMATTPVLTHTQLQADVTSTQAQIQKDIANIASGNHILSSSQNLAQEQALLAYYQKGVSTKNWTGLQQSSEIIGLTNALSHTYTSTSGLGNYTTVEDPSKYLNSPALQPILKQYLALSKGMQPGLAVQYLQNQLATVEGQIKTPAQLAGLGKISPTAAALVSIAGLAPSLNSSKQLASAAGQVTSASAAASYYTGIANQAVLLQAKENSYAQLAAQNGGDKTATGRQYLADASKVKDVIDDLEKAGESLSKRFRLSSESVKEIATAIATANAQALINAGITPSQFQTAVEDGVTNSANGLALLVNRINHARISH